MANHGEKIGYSSHIDFSKVIIAACCCLHNFCERENEVMPASNSFLSNEFEIPINRAVVDAGNSEGSQSREAICKYLANNFPLRQSMVRM